MFTLVLLLMTVTALKRMGKFQLRVQDLQPMVLGPETGQVSPTHASGVPGLEELEVQLVAISIIKRITFSFDCDTLCFMIQR